MRRCHKRGIRDSRFITQEERIREYVLRVALIYEREDRVKNVLGRGSKLRVLKQERKRETGK